MRPTGVTILAVLELVGGVFAILLGLGIAALGGVAASDYGFAGLGGLISVIGGAIAVAGILAIIIGWGLWKGATWAWYLEIIFAILGIFSGLFQLAVGGITGIVGLIIDVVILWYFWQPHVQQYFGRGGMSTTAAPMPAPQPTP